MKKNAGILQENVSVINETIKNGNEVCFVTGRPYQCQANDYSWIDKNSKMIYAFYNGLLIIDLNSKEILSKKTLLKETSQEIFELLKNTETLLVFFQKIETRYIVKLNQRLMNS